MTDFYTKIAFLEELCARRLTFSSAGRRDTSVPPLGMNRYCIFFVLFLIFGFWLFFFILSFFFSFIFKTF